MNRRLQIGVMGPSLTNYPADKALALKLENYSEEIGKLLAERNVLVLTGGCTGVMESVMRGAKRAGGTTIGFPGKSFGESNSYCDIEVLLDFDIASFAFSGMVSSHSLITFPIESAGTVLEIASAYRHKIPNVLLRGFNPDFEKRYPKYYDASKSIEFYWANTPNESVNLAIKLGLERMR